MDPPAGGDTIAAIATPPGRGGIGVVRVSGEAVPGIAMALAGTVPESRHVRLARFTGAEGSLIDQGLALFFRAPRSFTGEDVLELQVHGSPVVLDRLLRRVCELGARPARGGEFSERAFLNGKLDLAQAEAVADLIAARSEAQARAAARSLHGEFSDHVRELVAIIVRARVTVETAIDFVEDVAQDPSRTLPGHLLDEAVARIAGLLAAARRGQRLTRGVHVVIAGPPNVGKSSLLNALVESERAIVTPVAGTTRDVLREPVVLGGVELTLADTAGLHAAADVVEGEGIRRAWSEIARADLVLWVTEQARGDTGLGPLRDLPQAVPRLIVVNKIDVGGQPPARAESGGVVRIALSARTGAGVDLLRAELRHTALGGDAGGDVFSARARHVLALERARAALAAAQGLACRAGPELVAEELRSAQQALCEITGEFTTDDLLAAIFSTFCVGK